MSVLFIGLGRMGNPMARHIAATYETYVYDLDHAQAQRIATRIGAQHLPDLRTLDPSIDTVITTLPTSKIVESVLLGRAGLLNALPEKSLVIDMGSSEPESTRTLAQIAASRGIGYVDAPVSGGIAKAEEGTLSVLIGGEHDDVERARPLLETVGETLIHVGGVGAGDAAKAINNLVSAANISVVAEALSIGTKFGIDPARLVSVLNASTGRSQASEVKYPNFVLTGSFASAFSYDLMLKDLGIARGLAALTQTTTPVLEKVIAVLTEGREQLGAAPDHTEIARIYQNLNNVNFEAQR